MCVKDTSWFMMMSSLISHIILSINKIIAEYIALPFSHFYYDKMFTPNLTLLRAEKLKTNIIKLEHYLKIIRKDLYFSNIKLHNKFFFEFLPAISLAKRLGAIKISLQSEAEEFRQYDAEISFDNNEKVKVEFVTAMFHEDDRHRIEHVVKYGYAPVHEKVLIQGNIHNRTFDKSLLVSNAYNDKSIQNMIKNELEPIIIEVFDKKVKKQLKGAYQDNTILAIIVDDFRFDKELLDVSLISAEQQIQQTSNLFLHIYFIGNNGFFKKLK